MNINEEIHRSEMLLVMCILNDLRYNRDDIKNADIINRVFFPSLLFLNDVLLKVYITKVRYIDRIGHIYRRHS